MRERILGACFLFLVVLIVSVDCFRGILHSDLLAWRCFLLVGWLVGLFGIPARAGPAAPCGAHGGTAGQGDSNPANKKSQNRFPFFFLGLGKTEREKKFGKKGLVNSRLVPYGPLHGRGSCECLSGLLLAPGTTGAS